MQFDDIEKVKKHKHKNCRKVSTGLCGYSLTFFMLIYIVIFFQRFRRQKKQFKFWLILNC
jgi:hypothetical protein